MGIELGRAVGRARRSHHNIDGKRWALTLEVLVAGRRGLYEPVEDAFLLGLLLAILAGPAGQVEEVQQRVQGGGERSFKDVLRAGLGLFVALGQAGEGADVLLDDRRLAGGAEHDAVDRLEELIVGPELAERELDCGIVEEWEGQRTGSKSDRSKAIEILKSELRTVGDVADLGAGTLGDDELLLGGRGDRVDLDGRLTFALLAGFLCHLACDSMESGLMLLFGLNPDQTDQNSTAHAGLPVSSQGGEQFRRVLASRQSTRATLTVNEC